MLLLSIPVCLCANEGAVCQTDRQTDRPGRMYLAYSLFAIPADKPFGINSVGRVWGDVRVSGLGMLLAGNGYFHSLNRDTFEHE